MKQLTINNHPCAALIDDEDFERLSKFNWFAVGNLAIRTNGNISLASAVMCNATQMYDHKDRNPFNNQKINLRPCTVSQNQMNTVKRKGCSSKYKGVWLAKNKWRAKIMLNQKYTFLGAYDNEIDAAKAYDTAAIKLFGEFAVLNLPT